MNPRFRLTWLPSLFASLVFLSACVTSRHSSNEPTYSPTGLDASPIPTSLVVSTSLTPLSTQTESQVPGIDVPVTIYGLTFQITDATVQETFTYTGMEYRADKPGDHLLVIRAKYFSGDPQTASSWIENQQIWVTDERISTDYAQLVIQGTIEGEQNQIVWLFSVDPASEAFLLWLPQEQQVFLLPLMHPELVTPAPQPEATDSPLLQASPVIPSSPASLPPSPGIPFQKVSLPLLLEDFFNNSHEWVPRFDQTLMSVANRQLSVASTRQDYAGVAYCSVDCGPYKDKFYFQADLSIDHDSALAAGIVFGLSTHIDAYYVFMVSFRSGTFALFKRDPQEFVTLVDWDTSRAIAAFPADNTLAVYYSSGTIELYINSQKVGEYIDHFPYNAGMIGIYAGNKGITIYSNNVLVLDDKP